MIHPTAKIQDIVAHDTKVKFDPGIGDVVTHILTGEPVIVVDLPYGSMRITIRRKNWEEILVHPNELEKLNSCAKSW